ncbi:recombinase family protein [Bacillus cereus group sp. IBL03679]|uniref:recombinase family protein n=1 Tax=Bacillus cereus group sp. IBL03679 TaxID=3240095 RepID=UPI003D2F7207
MRRFFYIRVSSKGQSIERQLAAASELEISEEYICIDRASGKDFKRPEYQLMKRMLRKGDILYIQSLDRLGRNKQMILAEWQELSQEKQIDIVVLDMPLLNTMRYKDLNGIENLISDLILQLLSYMAEDERKRTREQQKKGIEVAMQKGITFGRKKIEIDHTFISVYQEWKQHKITAVEAMKRVGMKNNTFYRRVKEYEASL